MIRFAANLDMLFTELPLTDRFDAAARAGFEGVELLFPDQSPVAELQRALADSGLPLALINMPVPDWADGGRGLAAVPGAEPQFRENFLRGLELAQVLRAERLHILEGLAKGSAAYDTYRANLVWAAEAAGEQALTIEVINEFDIPGYFLSDFALAYDVLTEVAAPILGLQFDAYHAARITGDLLGCWRQFGHLARHIQIADTPGRHEPGSGQAPLPAFLKAVKDSHFDGWVSAEYRPQASTEAGLKWLTEMKRAGS